VKSFKDHRITIYENPVNLGCSGNYNKSLSYATGVYVKLLCGDDMIAPDCIEKQVNAFEANEGMHIVMVTGGKEIINRQGICLFEKKFPGKGFYEGKKAVRKSIFYGTNLFGEPGLPLMKTEVVRKTDGVGHKYCNDFELSCQVLLHGNLFVLSDVLFKFRILSTSESAKAGWSQAKSVKSYFSFLYGQKVYGISRSLLFWGNSMVNLMTFARNLIFRFMT
jgi:glycosyltransferase involved in cell wall biosynthesis